VNDTIKVLVVDDHAMVRESLAHRIEAEAGMEVAGTAGDSNGAVAMADKVHPDVVLMDINMPGNSCFDAVGRICQGTPEAKIIFLSAHATDSYIEQALRARAAGYVVKDEPVQSVIDAINVVASGTTYHSPSIRDRVVDIQLENGNGSGETIEMDGPEVRGSQLTPREIQVLRHVAQGLSAKQIAESMDISVRTVDRHRANIMNKLNIHDRVQLSLYAYREGLVVL
jgi:DNA-binding NarL/FixJ family response regulator